MIDYRSSGYLRAHVKDILNFYEPNVIDPNGGFFQNFLDDGQVFDPNMRHLVSSTRMTFNYCKAYQIFGEQRYLDYAKHGIRFIRKYHWDAGREGYHWVLFDRQPQDQTNHCYGLAFVVLAFATAYETGIKSAKIDLERAYHIMEDQLWLKDQGLYADEATPDWSHIENYRGQNANMHSCEAMLAAYKATGDHHYLERAWCLANKFTRELALKSDGLVWEHYRPNLNIDWTYNKEDPKNLYRPWGFQPGHQTEWAKLLLILYRYQPENWMIDRARELFDRALEVCWDPLYGGICYGFSPNMKICDDDKYFWVQAESIAAAARLAQVTGDAQYWRWYQKIWDYANEHMVDHKNGAWYRRLTCNNKKTSNQKSIAGGKCDYHTLGACCDVLESSNLLK
jgi:mannose/cellobiose epimerase-like protein (N-acyl-D-glucosamine 2-epimerase family)|tara:strand:+ start:8072 stop:9259 length:1188 start_codon:yes stop_codon:yes gene_type:complete